MRDWLNNLESKDENIKKAIYCVARCLEECSGERLKFADEPNYEQIIKCFKDIN